MDRRGNVVYNPAQEAEDTERETYESLDFGGQPESLAAAEDRREREAGEAEIARLQALNAAGDLTDDDRINAHIQFGLGIWGPMSTEQLSILAQSIQLKMELLEGQTMNRSSQEGEAGLELARLAIHLSRRGILSHLNRCVEEARDAGRRVDPEPDNDDF